MATTIAASMPPRPRRRGGGPSSGVDAASPAMAVAASAPPAASNGGGYAVSVTAAAAAASAAAPPTEASTATPVKSEILSTNTSSSTGRQKRRGRGRQRYTSVPVTNAVLYAEGASGGGAGCDESTVASARSAPSMAHSAPPLAAAAAPSQPTSRPSARSSRGVGGGGRKTYHHVSYGPGEAGAAAPAATAERRHRRRRFSAGDDPAGDSSRDSEGAGSAGPTSAADTEPLCDPPVIGGNSSAVGTVAAAAGIGISSAALVPDGRGAAGESAVGTVAAAAGIGISTAALVPDGRNSGGAGEGAGAAASEDDGNDDGRPGPSAAEDLRRSLELIRDERHLVAYDLYTDARGRIDAYAEERRDLIALDAAAAAAEEARSVVSAVSPSARNKSAPVATRGATTARATRHHHHKSTGGGLAAFAHSLAPTFRSPRGKQHSEAEGGAPAIMTDEQREHLEEYKEGRRILGTNTEEFDRLEKRALLFHRAKQNLTVIDDWIKAQTLFGITTYYRREPDRSLSIKLEGELTGTPLFEQLAVFRETDLFYTWTPFTTASRKLAQLGRLDVVSWFVCGIPAFGLSRDACFRAVGCDCMREGGSILIVGEGLGDKPEDGVKSSAELNDKVPAGRRGESFDDAASEQPPQPSSSSLRSSSEQRQRDYASARSTSGLVDDSYDDWDQANPLLREQETGTYLSRDEILETIEIPPIPTKFGSGRMTLRSFQGEIDILSPTSARTRIVANVDPNLRFLPNSLIDFCMKKMAGVLLSRMQTAARNAIEDPVRSPHARRMREDAGFYRHWLLPKFRTYCEDLGWEMPPVAAFTVPKDDRDGEEWLLHSRTEGGGAVRQSMSTGDLQALSARDAAGVAMAATTPAGYTSAMSSHSAASAPVTSVRQAPDGSTVSAPPSPPGISQHASSDRSGDRPHFFPSATMANVMDPTTDPPPNLLEQLSSDPKKILVAPQLMVQHTQMRRDRKKALEVAGARRKAALRNKPKPLEGDKLRRVAQLKQAKRRYEDKDSRGRQDDRSNGPAEGDGQTSVTARTRGVEAPIVVAQVLSPVQRALNFLSGCDPSAPGTRTLPILIVVMFGLYSLHVERFLSSSLLVSSEERPAEDLPSASWRQYATPRVMLKLVAREAIFASLLALSALLFWSVLTTTLVAAFDSIQLPGGIDYSKLDSGKRIYVASVRLYTALLTAGVVAVGSSKALLLGLGRGVAAHGGGVLSGASPRQLLAKLADSLNALSQTTGLATIFRACGHVLRWCGVPLRALFFKPAFDAVQFFAIGLNDLFWEARITSYPAHAVLWAYRGLSSLTSIAFSSLASMASGTDSHGVALSWRVDALQTSQCVMSYTAVFVVSILLVAGVILPKVQQKRRRKGRRKATSSAASVSRSTTTESATKNKNESPSVEAKGRSVSVAASRPRRYRQRRAQRGGAILAVEVDGAADDESSSGGSKSSSSGGSKSSSSGFSLASRGSSASSASAISSRSLGSGTSSRVQASASGESSGSGLGDLRGMASREETIYEDDEEEELSGGGATMSGAAPVRTERVAPALPSDDGDSTLASATASATVEKEKGGGGKVKRKLRKMRKKLSRQQTG